MLLGNDVRFASWPSPSPDGRHLYFQMYSGPEGLAGRDQVKGHWQLRRLDLESGEVVSITVGEARQQIRASS